MLTKIKSFAADETAAVTVDWVVLTSAGTGLGMATIGAVSGGLESLSTETSNTMSNIPVGLSWFTNQVAENDFSGGDVGDWIGGVAMSMGGELGEMLIIPPGESVGFTVDVPPGSGTATMVFDLVAGDSHNGWGDRAEISVNGVPVAVATSQGGNSLTFDIPQIDGTTTQATVTTVGTNLGGLRGQRDAVAQVTITVDDPVGEVDLQIYSDANQAIRNEYWAIDNFDATTSR